MLPLCQPQVFKTKLCCVNHQNKIGKTCLKKIGNRLPSLEETLNYTTYFSTLQSYKISPKYKGQSESSFKIRSVAVIQTQGHNENCCLYRHTDPHFMHS
jgi:hypothetical protein